MSLALAARYGPGWIGSPLLQGDVPGHLETMRRYADAIWPLPWGWDPRYLLGTPVGILYPPLFHWLGGGLGKVVGVAWGMKLLVLAAVVAMPPALYAAARGLGLRAREGAFAAALGMCVLWLPGPGLGGTLRQTFVAGNVANTFALPIYFLLVATLRRGLLRPRRWVLPAMLLALCLLTHFLVGAVAGLTVVAFSLFTRRLLRGAAIAGLGLLAAAPFLVPFLVHFRDGSPDVISYAPLPFPVEWLGLLVLVGATAVARRRRALLPIVAALVALYVVRALLPFVGELPFRMEWHRFRLFLYLSLVPAGLVALRRWPRAAWAGASGIAGFAVLLVAFPYDARGPERFPYPAELPSYPGERILVVASPASQDGSWHGLMTRLPLLLGGSGAGGVFVEASPYSRAVFELERLLVPQDPRPRWWAIRMGEMEPSESSREFVSALLERGLGITRVVAGSREVVRTYGGHDLGPTLLRIFDVYGWPGPPPPIDPEWRWTGRSMGIGAVPFDALPTDAARVTGDGARLEVASVDGSDVEVFLFVNGFPDWGVESGEGTLEIVPHREFSPYPYRDDPFAATKLLRVRTSSTLRIACKPRGEEWTGLWIGAFGFAAIGTGAIVSRRRQL